MQKDDNSVTQSRYTHLQTYASFVIMKIDTSSIRFRTKRTHCFILLRKNDNGKAIKQTADCPDAFEIADLVVEIK